MIFTSSEYLRNLVKLIIQMPLRNRMAFVIGSEDRGIRAINLKECDEVRSIPMTGLLDL